GLEHQGARWAHANAVPAIDARRVRQRNVELCSNVCGKPSPSHCDGKSILCVHTAGFHTLVTKDALGVIAHIEIVVNLRGLGHSCSRWTKAFWMSAITFHIFLESGRLRDIDRRSQKFQHNSAAEPDALRIRLDGHSRFNLA